MISVIIPVRNGEPYIVEAVSSALAQGDCVREVIVVDDGSTDATIASIQAIADPRIRLFTSRGTRPSGVSGGRNFGFEQATQPWVMFLDADDRLRPGACSALLAAAGPADVVAVYGDYERIDAAGTTIGRRRLLGRRAKPEGDVTEKLLAGNFLVNGGVALMRAESFRKTAGFREDLRYCEDWHAWCLLAAQGEFLYVPGLCVMDYRVHAGSTMMAKRLSFDDYRPALDAIYAEPRLTKNRTPERLRTLRQAAEAHLRAYLAAQAVRDRRYLTALQGLVQAIITSPSKALRNTALVGSAAFGI